MSRTTTLVAPESHRATREYDLELGTLDGSDDLHQLLEAGGRLIPELETGANQRAILTGHILEDKSCGDGPSRFGTSVYFGGINVSTVHSDGILLQPTVELEGVR